MSMSLAAYVNDALGPKGPVPCGTLDRSARSTDAASAALISSASAWSYTSSNHWSCAGSGNDLERAAKRLERLARLLALLLLPRPAAPWWCGWSG